MRDGTEGLLVTVADIIALPAFKNVELVAPCEGAERREVRNVGILDCPPDYNEYSVYVAGELILTNLGFAFGNPGMAEKSLLTMLRRDVAAIAVKTVYEPPISDAVRKESTARGEQLARWSGLHLSAFASAARYDRLFMSASELYRSMLAGYDDEHGTELVRTAEALVNWHGDVKAIAEELHQHPNTVRYRMRKMKAVLGIPHEDDKVFINLLSLVFLPELG